MRRLAGSHAPNCRNRSSKHLNLIIGQRPALRSASSEYLKKHAEEKGDVFNNELARREKARIKKQNKSEKN